MKGFFIYCAAMLTGNNIVHKATIPTQVTMDELFQRIRDFLPNKKFDKINIYYDNGILEMDEIYDNDAIRNNGGGIVFNKSFTIVSKNANQLEITIEIERPPKGRMNAILLIGFNFIFLGALLLDKYKSDLNLEQFQFNTVHNFLYELLVLTILIIMYRISLVKPQNIIKLIRENAS